MPTHDTRAISSVGRAPPLQGGGHWFETGIAHHSFSFIILLHLKTLLVFVIFLIQQ